MMDPLQRALAAAAAAKSSAYSADARCAAMRRELDLMRQEINRLVEHVRQQDRRIASLEQVDVRVAE